MAKLSDWCSSASHKIKSHELVVYTGEDSKLPKAIDSLAKDLPAHYAGSGRIAHILKRLGKTKAAKYVTDKLPTSKCLRSGDLGEIVASIYVADQSGFSLAVNRFHWKDHREMAMRGDDIIALARDGNRVKFLKGEAKSRASLVTSVVSEARKSLKKNGGRPSPHALSFVADRLYEQGNVKLADGIDVAMYKTGIPLKDVEHLLFTFSGNDPTNFLESDLKKYGGKIQQHAIGLRIVKHGTFVKKVFAKVIQNAVDN